MQKNPLMIDHRAVLLFTFFLSVFVGGCATVPSDVPFVDQSRVLKRVCAQHKLQCSVDSVSQVLTIVQQDQKAKVLVGSDIVLLGKERIKLRAPVERRRSSIILPLDFKEKVIDQLKAKPMRSFSKFSKVIIDAGHGGRDPGAIGRTGTREKDIVLDIAKRLKKVLEDSGVEVEMTRTSDVFISLEERTQIASRSRADLFVSIHANANRSRRVTGLEVYFEDPEVRLDREQQEQVDKNRDLYFQKMSMDRQNREVRKIVEDLLALHKTKESERIAGNIAAKTSKYVGLKTRGELSADYFVLRNNLMPAVLVEVGYLSNAWEEKFLKKTSSRQKVAEGIAKGILQYAK